MFIRFITTGGTIDKIYFDELSQFEVGESQVRHILTDGLVSIDYDVVPMMQKDSLEMTDADRRQLHDFVANDDAERYIITHGTDTAPAHEYGRGPRKSSTDRKTIPVRAAGPCPS
ncbi:MAG: asparaginase [Proteobacteria bacterium]|nr:asparaginase [Pseudomonadota bacterium]